MLPEAPPCDLLEGTLRVEVRNAFPKFLQQKAQLYGYWSTVDLLFLFHREVMPHEDMSRLTLESEIYSLSDSKAKTTYNAVLSMIEKWMSKVHVATQMNVVFGCEAPLLDAQVDD